ncbi:hypothetical protein CFP56_011867 [Quercus suber]|uniref:Uncharacterized protein n=1 Tax=Quercus suber TaxID=58331 RepID=A0AAW0KYZ7_QUESU
MLVWVLSPLARYDDEVDSFMLLIPSNSCHFLSACELNKRRKHIHYISHVRPLVGFSPSAVASQLCNSINTGKAFLVKINCWVNGLLKCILVKVHSTEPRWDSSSAFLPVISSIKITPKLYKSTLVVTRPVPAYSGARYPKVPASLVSTENFPSGASRTSPKSDTLARISSPRRMFDGFRSLWIKL